MGGGVVLGFLFRGLFSKKEDDPIVTTKPTFKETAATKVAEIDAQSLAEKATALAATEVKKAEVEEIKKEPDPVERRRKLAGWLKENL